MTSFPRVGSKRAQRLIEHFGALERMVAATREELAAVPGIGKQTAQLIHWAVHESTLSYRV